MKAKQLILIAVPVIVLVIVLALWFMRDEAGAPSVPNQNTQEQLSRPEIIKISGEIICLPHKDTSGPQTLECALGLKDEGGENYSLSTSSPDQISSLPVGSKVTVMARSEPPAPNSNYDIVGSLQVQTVVRE